MAENRHDFAKILAMNYNTVYMGEGREMLSLESIIWIFLSQKY